MKQGNKGFTLVELMIVIAIIGILAAVGYPAYTSYVKKGNRADAVSTLLYEAGRMEEYYMNNNAYTGAAVSNVLSKDGHYDISINIPAGGLSYTLTATARATDGECLTLTLDSLGTKASTGTYPGCW